MQSKMLSLAFPRMESQVIPFPRPVFTVYQTQTTIELHQGNEDIPALRVICSLSSYDSAKHFGMLAADIHNLPFIDYVHPGVYPDDT